MYTTDCIAIKDIRPGLKNINVQFIVLEVGNATVTKENREVRTFKVADQTACINVSIWGEPGNLLFPGDIVRLTKGYAVIWRQCLTLYSGKNGEIHKIGDFCMLFNEQLNMSEPNPNFGPQGQQQGAGGGAQLNQQQQQQVMNGGNVINGNNNGRGGGGGQGQGPSGFNGNPNSPNNSLNSSNNPPASSSSASPMPSSKTTRLSNENKGGGGGANAPVQKNSRGGRSSNSRSNVK